MNDADELKESNEKDAASSRKVSSNPELELSVEREEPRAVLVEVEDDIQEVVDPLSAAATGSKGRPTIGQNKIE